MAVIMNNNYIYFSATTLIIVIRRHMIKNIYFWQSIFFIIYINYNMYLAPYSDNTI